MHHHQHFSCILYFGC